MFDLCCGDNTASNRVCGCWHHILNQTNLFQVNKYTLLIVYTICAASEHDECHKGMDILYFELEAYNNALSCSVPWITNTQIVKYTPWCWPDDDVMESFRAGMTQIDAIAFYSIDNLQLLM